MIPPDSDGSDFAADYSAARARFLSAAATAAAVCETLPVAGRGPGGEALSIDVAWLGSARPERAVLVLSGVHGVEGCAGSAAQVASLRDRPSLCAGTALILVHAVNPWGWAHLRRVNANNVDLNRNGLREGERYEGAAPAARRLDALLNPASPPRRDAFLVRLAARILLHGYGGLRQAVARGQYENDRGLFFGGRALQEEPRLLFDWVARRLAGVPEALVLDLHSGLGPRGVVTLFADARTPASAADGAPVVPGVRVVAAAQAGRSGGYVTRGDLCGRMRDVLAGSRLLCYTVEVGTWSGPRLLAALRDENRWHHWGGGGLDHPAKARLREAFAPSSPDWRRTAVHTLRAVVAAALARRG